jgi:spore coat protein U-like protein
MNRMHTSKKVAATVAAGVMVALAGAAHAFTRSDSFTVEVLVETNCSIDATDMNLGTYLGDADLSAQSTITVACTAGTDYSSSLSTGSSGDYAARELVLGADSLVYNLYTDSGWNTVWGDGTASTAVVPGTGFGMGSPVALNVYGLLQASQNTAGVAVGTYTDTITATVTY